MKTVFFVFVLVTFVVAFASAEGEPDDELLEFQDLLEEYKRGGRRSRNTDISSYNHRNPYSSTCNGRPYPTKREGYQCLCLSRGPICVKKTFVSPSRRRMNTDISSYNHRNPYSSTCNGRPYPTKREGYQCLCLSRGPICVNKYFVSPSRRRMCLDYGTPCKVNFIGAHDCCKRFGCYGPAGTSCKKELRASARIINSSVFYTTLK
ncbi:uncharacterized protein [Amphiura filiformis]|uniref:uncharacterized protein isoform X2 n=1 Tax=Amphiura filiformis TaxID=82378 RepID=UPI003B221332